MGGRCDNGQSCNGVGNICGAGTLPDGGAVDINASQNCCDGRKDVCKVDSSGVPRCFGGGTGPSGACPSGYTGEAPCCIASNDTCQFSEQCCDGALCLPAGDGTGRLSCQRPTCDPVGTNCTTDATCCAGTKCLPTSELTKACQVPYTPPPPTDGGTPPTDGGTTTPDAGGVCQANGTTCSAGTQCCSSICSGRQVRGARGVPAPERGRAPPVRTAAPACPARCRRAAPPAPASRGLPARPAARRALPRAPAAPACPAAPRRDSSVMALRPASAGSPSTNWPGSRRGARDRF